MYKIVLLFLIISLFTYGKGVIITDEAKIIKIFRDGSYSTISNLVNEVSANYNEVILHLGNRYSFNRGNLFFYKTSKENLEIFSNLLVEKDINLYLWFYDSFGDKEFNEIYLQYKDIYTENKKWIERLNLTYSGYVLDLEWINKPNGNNNTKFLEILNFFKTKEPDKKLYHFASLVEDINENISRGYSEDKILKIADNILPMLYIKDGGFFIRNNQLLPYLNDNRIDSLINYYKKRNYKMVISQDKGIVILNENKTPYFVRTMPIYADFNDLLNYEILDTHDQKYYQIFTVKVTKETKLQKDDGSFENLQKGQIVYLLKTKENILKYSDFNWEYFLFHE